MVGLILFVAVMPLLMKIATPELARVEQGLDYHLSKCIIPDIQGRNKPGAHDTELKKPGNNVIHVIYQMSFCWKTTLHKCDVHKYDKTGTYKHRNLLCGVLHHRLSHISVRWTLAVYYQYSIHITFLEFHLPCSQLCNKAMLIAELQPDSTQWFTYCGKRAPWSVSCNLPICYINVQQSNTLSHGFFFTLVYEAIDSWSPLIDIKEREDLVVHNIETLHALCHLTKQNSYTDSLHSKYNYYLHYGQFLSVDHLKVSAFGNHYGRPRHMLQTFHFMAPAYQVICIVLPRDINITVYDGPGPLSRVLYPSHEERNTDICFSSFLGYAVILTHNISVVPNITWITKFVSMLMSEPNSLCQQTATNEGLHLKAYDAGSDLNCIWRTQQNLDEMRIHHISFSGYDIFSSLLHESICQYGGLYVLSHYKTVHGKEQCHQYFTLCNSIRNQPSLHLLRAPHVIAQYIMFITFVPFSFGSIEVSLTFSGCQPQFHIINCIKGDFRYLGLSRPTKFWPLYETVPHCKHIWMTHNLDIQREVHHNCTITKTFAELSSVLLIGTHKAVVHNWIIQPTQHADKSIDTSNYNFLFNVTIIKAFPLDTTEIQHNTVVERDSVVEIHLPHLRGLMFSTNDSVMDLDISVVQIQLFQNRICLAVHGERVISSNTQLLYLDTQVRAYFAISREALSLCYQVFKGKACVASTTPNHAVLVIDYVYSSGNPISRFVQYKLGLDTKVNITIMNTTQQCLELCSLDVTIWENLKFIPKVVRMYEWKNVTGLLWRFHATGHGFRLRIAQTCFSPCSYMCDISMITTVYYNTLNCMAHFNFSGHISDETYGSWHDVDAYCEDKELQLLTFNFDNGEFDDTFGRFACLSTKQQEGMNPDEQTYFVGLYKSSQVCIIS